VKVHALEKRKRQILISRPTNFREWVTANKNVIMFNTLTYPDPEGPLEFGLKKLDTNLKFL
jgi:hypothetical protein